MIRIYIVLKGSGTDTSKTQRKGEHLDSSTLKGRCTDSSETLGKKNGVEISTITIIVMMITMMMTTMMMMMIVYLKALLPILITVLGIDTHTIL